AREQVRHAIGGRECPEPAAARATVDIHDEWQGAIVAGAREGEQAFDLEAVEGGPAVGTPLDRRDLRGDLRVEARQRAALAVLPEDDLGRLVRALVGRGGARAVRAYGDRRRVARAEGRLAAGELFVRTV